MSSYVVFSEQVVHGMYTADDKWFLTFDYRDVVQCSQFPLNPTCVRPSGGIDRVFQQPYF